jgi:hypothetical protein
MVSDDNLDAPRTYRSTMTTIRRLGPFTPLLLLAAAYAPHDTWLLVVPAEPGRGHLALSLRTGMDFPTSENAVEPARIRAQYVDPQGKATTLAGFVEDEASKSSVLPLAALAAGVHVATADTEPRVLKMDARKFNDYLLHDGLPHVLAERLDDHEEGLDAIERYRKCAKVVFATGPGGGAFDRPVGQALEIVPLDDPTRVQPRQTLRVRVLFEDKPLVHGNLCWDRSGNGEDFAGSTWTDAEGEALVPIARPGLMTVRLVHMTRPRQAEFEWESFWASCTFEVRAP